MTPEEYIEKQIEKASAQTLEAIMADENYLYLRLGAMEGEGAYRIASESKFRQALKDTWNEALTQVEGVLPGEREETRNYEQVYPVMLNREFNTCREQSLQAIDKLKLK